MVTVKVPATSANVGAGFDTLGLAVSLYNTVSMEEWDTLDIQSTDGSQIPTDESNLIYRSAKSVYDRVGKPLTGMRIRQQNPIPMARGLGSSSACIVAGVLGANALLGNPLSQREMLTLATMLEGHPDNVAPALLGGFVTSVFDEGQVYSVSKKVHPELVFAAFVPDFKLLTEEARAVLPEQITRRDAIYNISRAALAATAFEEADGELLRIVTKDTIHQQYRLPLIPGGEQVFAIARDLGAYAVYLSGAGPTIMAVVHRDNADFFEQAHKALQEQAETKRFCLHRMLADNTGAVVL